MAKGHLKYALLKCLSQEPLSGYGLMKKIEAKAGAWHPNWRPSFGSIYPHLKTMQEEGLLKSKKKGRSIVYELTPPGRAALDVLSREQKGLFMELMARMKVFYNTDDHFDTKALKIWELVMQGDDPFSEINDHIIRFKKAMFDLADKNIIKKNKKEITAILETATRGMESIRRRS
ncbi:MAG: PadR family transcriptional regulator [DPANN group archaeon]|nr:PadR family transcriptional regulator [DPANN group archaeon]